jgi:hypothetical protein
MFGDPRELVEQTLLARLNGLTTADGLPQPFRFVTREFTHMADVEERGLLPACLMQMEEPEVIPKLSFVYETNLPGRLIVAFSPSVVLPATDANAYRLALERMLVSDIHMNGLCDLVSLRGSLMPGLWQEVGLLALGVLFSVLYEYSPLAPALTA